MSVNSIELILLALFGAVPDKGCFNSVYGLFDGKIRAWDSAANWYRFILTDGMNVDMNTYDATFSGTAANQGSVGIGLYFDVDVNGNKPPNTVGKDVFTFVLKKDGFYVRGCDFDACSGMGLGCTCKIFKEKKWIDQ